MSQIMYIGPEVRGVVGKNEVFTYDPKEKKEKVKAIYEPAEKFFVDMEHLTEKRNELRRTGSYMDLLYKNFEKKLGEK